MIGNKCVGINAGLVVMGFGKTTNLTASMLGVHHYDTHQPTTAGHAFSRLAKWLAVLTASKP